jgi:hypothetical protein
MSEEEEEYRSDTYQEPTLSMYVPFIDMCVPVLTITSSSVLYSVMFSVIVFVFLTVVLAAYCCTSTRLFTYVAL